MNKLIDEISAIVAKYGEDIVTESRFVNILKDLYPDRDNPKKFNILSELISQGTIANLLNCKKSNIKSFVERHSVKLSKKQGFDKADVSHILYAIAVGTNSISRSEYNSFINPPEQKPTSKQQPKPQKPQPAQNQDEPSTTEVLSLIWAFIGLCATPFIYLNLLTNGWWPFWAVVILALVGVITIVPASIAILGDGTDIKKVNPVLAGAHFTITLCYSLFLTLAPFIIHWTYDAFSSQYLFWFGHAYHSDFGSVTSSYIAGFENPTVLTFLLGLFCSAVALTPFGLDGKSINNLINSPGGGFVKGATRAGIALVVVTVLCLMIPAIANWNHNNQVKAENEKYEEELKQVEELRKSRASTSMEMSFKDFFLGQDFEQCNAIINDTPSYIANENSTPSYNPLMIDSINYTSVVDTTLCATTEWDNKETTVYLFFNNKKLIGIRLAINHELDSLVSMYSAKYGKPEHIPVRKDKYQTSSISFEDRVNDTYCWTYKNGIVQIQEEYYSCYIIYFDRAAETMLQNLQAKEEAERQRQIKEAEMAEQKALEEERKRAEAERLRQQENHKKAVNQI